MDLKKLLVFVIVGLLSINVFSQIQHKYKRVENNYNKYLTVCDLTEVQKKDLLVVLNDRHEAFADFKNEHKKDKESLRNYAAELKKVYSPKVKAIIGEENMKKMESHRGSQIKENWDVGVL
ncbi:hypothetical protein E9993_12610 [Labilibacter sediminis]|nr:hypothetical protein E9993_12610 [Labilibacter sediminis]